ncbi:MAG TPA: Cu(I)-responsive transcriptional regulator [Povalibacter sp.]|jgi:MerR family transcriptional regulator, copper efflux regulator
MKIHERKTAAALTGASARYNIGRAAAVAGVSAKMIRHYESTGLIPAADRTIGNYRTYSDNDIHTLIFVQRARALGFSMKQIGVLVSLWRNRGRSSAQVRRLATEHITELKTRIASMQAMVRTLEELAEHCHGDVRPDCPILDDLAKLPATTASRPGVRR